MKNLFLTGTALLTLVSGSAMAADLGRPAPAPVYTKAPPPVPVFTWTGFYIGGNIGAAWAQHNWTDSVFLVNFNNFVIGLEGTFDWAANNNNNNTGIVVPSPANHLIAVTANDKCIATLAAR